MLLYKEKLSAGYRNYCKCDICDIEFHRPASGRLGGIQFCSYKCFLASDRKRLCQPSVFQDFVTEEECYWLGFLFADGWITKDLRSICISCSGKDKLHLQKFANYVNKKLYSRKRYDKRTNKIYHECSVNYSNTISGRLFVSLGFVPCKTHKETHIPDILPLNMISHFIRGYFDGDGCIRVKPIYWKTVKGEERISNQLSFGIANGHPSILDDIATILKTICKAKLLTKKMLDSKCWTISCCGNGVCKDIYNYLYRDATIYLERKYNIFLSLRR